MNEKEFGDRNFFEIKQGRHVNEELLLNLEYILRVSNHGTYEKQREGGIIESNKEQYPYSIQGRIFLKPMDSHKLPNSQDYSYLTVSYYLGDPWGATVKPKGDEISKFGLPKDEVHKIVDEYLPNRIITGQLFFATLEKLPGDFTREEFLELLKNSLKLDLKAIGKAQKAFLDSYGATINQYNIEDEKNV